MARCPSADRPRNASRASSTAPSTRTPAAARSPRFTCSILECASDSSAALLSDCVDRPAAAFPAVTASKLNPSCRSLAGLAFDAAFTTGATEPRRAAPAAAALTAAFAATRSSPASGGRRCASARNSRSRKRASAASRSYTPISPPVAGSASGASRSIVISPCPANAASRFAASASRMRTGSTSSRRLYNCSREPKVEINFEAVFSPTPGTPGMLSELSPLSDLKSTICSGVRPYRAKTRSGSYSTIASAPPLAVCIRCTFLVTSCSMSRSPETMCTSQPSRSAAVAMVPITSSAS